MRRTLKAVAGICMLVGVLAVSGSAAGAQAPCGGYLQPGCDKLTFDYPTPVNVAASIKVEGFIDDVGEETSRATATSPGTGTRGTTIAFTIGGKAAGTLDVEADGTFEGNITVPDVAAGQSTIRGTTGDLVAEGPIEILGSGVGGNGNNNNGNGGTGTATGSSPLARTGFDATPMITLGAAAVVLGAAAVFGSKRRRTA